jgi:hypothetical protein
VSEPDEPDADAAIVARLRAAVADEEFEMPAEEVAAQAARRKDGGAASTSPPAPHPPYAWLVPWAGRRAHRVLELVGPVLPHSEEGRARTACRPGRPLRGWFYLTLEAAEVAACGACEAVAAQGAAAARAAWARAVAATGTWHAAPPASPVGQTATGLCGLDGEVAEGGWALSDKQACARCGRIAVFRALARQSEEG